MKLNNEYYLEYNNKLLTPLNFNEISNNGIININLRIKGGIITKVIGMIFKFLDPLTSPITDIIMALVSMVGLLIDFLKIFPKLVKSAFTIFTPDKFINDVLFGVLGGIKLIFGGILGSINSDIVGDQSSTYNGPFGVSENGKKKKPVCVKPTLMNLIILLLCPPLAIFLHKGIYGMGHIFICSLMTYFLYYFPGLIYASLLVLC